MVSREKLQRQYWRERYELQLDALEDAVEVCAPYAVREIKRLTHNLLISVKNGEISGTDYEELDKRLERLVSEFMSKCVRKKR